MHFYLAIILSIGVVATASLQIRPALFRASEQPALYGAATMALIALVALLSPTPMSVYYKGAIEFGLLLSILSVFCLLSPAMPPAVGFGHLFLVHFVYFLAFAGMARLRLPTPWVLLTPIYGVALYYGVAPRLYELRSTVIAYIVLLLLVVWQALELWAQTGARWAGLGVAGVLFVLVANTILLVENFRLPIRYGRTLIAGFFYLGQLLLAWSVWGGSLRWLE
jgi:uncharacterized membrane protein YhhN